MAVTLEVDRVFTMSSPFLVLTNYFAFSNWKHILLARNSESRKTGLLHLPDDLLQVENQNPPLSLCSQAASYWL
jgi:hypothetical protein